jgi:NADH dehydrogenase [ubiquinone] 1 alpha subcomplex assembly factor 7
LSPTLAGVSEQPPAAIRAAIQDHGPITFSEFMELALYGPGGFYEEPPVGEGGHFVTSPHVHWIFATMLAKALHSMWEGLGRPVPFRLVELGAGDGTLARRLLTEFEAVPLEYIAVERSAGARRALGELPVTAAASLEVIDADETAVVFANELFDNLPFEWVRQTEQGPMQVFVEASGDRFVAIDRAWPKELAVLLPELRVGEAAAVSFEAVRIVERLARILAHGYVLLIDYGSAGPAQVHGYRRHRVIADVLSDPGTADITAGVDLEDLGRRAELLGMRRLRTFSQRSALAALGIVEWFQDQRKLQGISLNRGEGREAVRSYEARNRASLLMDPAGLGGLRWLLLSTADRGWPAWAERAADADR